MAKSPNKDTDFLGDLGKFLFFFFNKFIYLFILFLAALGLHCCTQAFSSCSAWGTHCDGFSLFQSTGSRHGLL